MNNISKILFSCLLTSFVLLTNTHAADDQENGLWQGMRRGLMQVLPGMKKIKTPRYKAFRHDENRAPMTENIPLEAGEKAPAKLTSQKSVHQKAARYTRPLWQNFAFLNPIVVRFPHLRQSFFEQSNKGKLQLNLLWKNPQVRARCQQLWDRGIHQGMIVQGKNWNEIADSILKDEMHKKSVAGDVNFMIYMPLDQSNNVKEENKMKFLTNNHKNFATSATLALVGGFFVTAPVQAADNAGPISANPFERALSRILLNAPTQVVAASRAQAEADRIAAEEAADLAAAPTPVHVVRVATATLTPQQIAAAEALATALREREAAAEAAQLVLLQENHERLTAIDTNFSYIKSNYPHVEFVSFGDDEEQARFINYCAQYCIDNSIDTASIDVGTLSAAFATFVR